MGAKIAGDNYPVLHWEETGGVDKDGVWKVTRKLTVRREHLLDAIEDVDAEHPTIPGLLVVGAQWAAKAGGAVSEVVLTYQGGGPDGRNSSRNGGLPPTTYNLDVTDGKEPIATHPSFSSRIGGTAAAPLNGAGKGFGANGAFERFPSTEDVPEELRGVSSYAVPAFTWVETSYVRMPPVSEEECVIQRPPGNPPKIGVRDWLYLGATFEKKGGIYQVKRRWRLSGPAGWSKLIYADYKKGDRAGGASSGGLSKGGIK
jgi:hypothetical protein